MPSSEVFVYFVFVLGNIDFEKMSFERIGRTGVWKKITKAGAGAKPRKGETVFAHYVRYVRASISPLLNLQLSQNND